MLLGLSGNEMEEWLKKLKSSIKENSTQSVGNSILTHGRMIMSVLWQAVFLFSVVADTKA